MKVKTILTMIFILFLSFGCLRQFLIPTNEIDNNDPAKKEDMLAACLEWGRLAPLPKTKKEFDIKTEGNMFTRTFRFSFIDSKVNIEKWINDSPGPSEAEIEVIDENTRIYKIKPGGGANTAKLTVIIIDENIREVKFYTCWS